MLIKFSSGVPDYVKSTVDTIMQIHATEGPGVSFNLITSFNLFVI